MGDDVNYFSNYLLKSFFIVFPSNKKYKVKDKMSLDQPVILSKVQLTYPFCVNEEEFIQQLEEWNVPVTETKRYKRWKYTGKI